MINWFSSKDKAEKEEKVANPQKNQFVKFSLSTLKQNPEMIFREYDRKIKETQKLIDKEFRKFSKNFKNDLTREWDKQINAAGDRLYRDTDLDEEKRQHIADTLHYMRERNPLIKGAANKTAKYLWDNGYKTDKAKGLEKKEEEIQDEKNYWKHRDTVYIR